MAALSIDEIAQLIRQIGLAPTKAKNIHRLSQRLVEEFDGEVPADMAALESLPGVGHKTASVVIAQAGIPAFPVDTHIHRLAADGDCHRVRMSSEQRRTSKPSFLAKSGMHYICRSSSSVVNRPAR